MMKEAIVSVSRDSDISIDIIESPIPEPVSDHVLIKVAVAGSNPKDWKVPLWTLDPHNSGDDIAGTIQSVGSSVLTFKPGDRVAAFHTVRAPGGSFAEYALAPAHMTFAIPEHISYDEAATVPLAAMAAAVGLYLRMRLPEPWVKIEEGKRVPLVVYGAASAMGAFAIQLAKLSGVAPIIGVAGRAKTFVEGLLDLEAGDDAIVSGIRTAMRKARVGELVPYVFDAISEGGSHENIAQIVGLGSHVTHVHPPDGYGNYMSFAGLVPERFTKTKDFECPQGVVTSNTLAGDIANGNPNFGFVFSRFFGWAMEKGMLKGHPFEVVAGGLGDVKEGMNNLKAGKNSGVNYVFRIGETEAIGRRD